ncbi:MAG: glycosyltransferase family 2 protein [Halomonas sp.]|uniref:glycosyltransferase family 2 protein n=1 Tax=Halomonas sp. TaxID=1486246 RepID=UPI003F8EFAC9
MITEPHLCAVVPVYNHPDTITSVCTQLSKLGLPVVLVDDGCDANCRQILEQLNASGYHLVTHEKNHGKGAAVRSGLVEAKRLGFTHGLQVDADGQHHVDDLPAFLEAMHQAPGTLIVSYACYDDSVPKARLYGRYATHVWVWINTLSRHIRDTMCGVRLYPLAPVNALLDRHACGDRMTFDTEVLVRWYWSGGALKNLPVRVHYPEQGVSHFAMWRDNAQISLMHTRLFFGMLARVPRLLRRRRKQP